MTVLAQIAKATLPMVVPIVIDIVMNHYWLKRQNKTELPEGPVVEQDFSLSKKQRKRRVK